MITTAILLNYNTTVGTIFGVRSHVISGAGVITTFLQPLFNSLTVCRCVVLYIANKAELGIATLTGHPQWSRGLQCVEHSGAVGVCAGTQSWMCLSTEKQTGLKHQVGDTDKHPVLVFP